jgi:hypothetical protein
MEKIDIQQSSYGDFKKDQNKLEEIKKNILKKTGIEPKSVRLSSGKVIVKANNNYEAIEIRLKIPEYLELNDIKVI